MLLLQHASIASLELHPMLWTRMSYQDPIAEPQEASPSLEMRQHHYLLLSSNIAHAMQHDRDKKSLSGSCIYRCLIRLPIVYIHILCYPVSALVYILGPGAVLFEPSAIVGNGAKLSSDG